MAVHYLEITLTALYQRMHALSFGPPDPDLGQARVATYADGTLVDIRKPLAAHEQRIMRTYLAVEDIPDPTGTSGYLCLVIQGGVQHGLWQR